MNHLISANLKQNGTRVRSVFSSQEALEILVQMESPEPDGLYGRVIVDANLPGAGGYEILAFLRTSPRFSQTWVALIGTDEELDQLADKPHQPDIYLIHPLGSKAFEN